jgi:hypothetical protein
MTMSNTEDEKEREERALDALIASAFKEDVCDVDENEVERFSKALTDADRAALDALGPNFIQSLFAGGIKKSGKKVRGQLATAMNRSEEDQPPSDKAKEEMERKVREAEEKRKAENQGGQEGADDGR